ncbi:hypothetical protein M8J77_002327 [Diaphorina citri]|nr:hypothetical protein M8J77_002327 [Diaphorina citri]
MEKRRRLKRSGLEKIEYAEISKLLRRKLKEWLEERKVKRLVDALENGGKLKERPKVRKVITCLNDKQGNEIREKDKILDRVKEFYEELYEGQRSEEDEEEKEETMMIESSDEWEDILEDESFAPKLFPVSNNYFGIELVPSLPWSVVKLRSAERTADC